MRNAKKQLTLEVINSIIINIFYFREFDFSKYDLTNKVNPAVQKLKNIVIMYILKYKSLQDCKMPELDLSEIDFTDVCIEGANLKGTGARIDPQKVKNKNLANTNLEGLDLSKGNFTDVSINGANLNFTNATIDLNKIRDKDFRHTRLQGCNIIGEPKGLSYSEYTFSEEYKMHHPKYFLDCNEPRNIKDLFYNHIDLIEKVSLKDIDNLSNEKLKVFRNFIDANILIDLKIVLYILKYFTLEEAPKIIFLFKERCLTSKTSEDIIFLIKEWGLEHFNDVIKKYDIDYQIFIVGEVIFKLACKENGTFIEENTFKEKNDHAILETSREVIDSNKLLAKLISKDELNKQNMLASNENIIDNKMLTSLKTNNYEELMALAKKVLPTYQDSININPYITFGLELEFVDANSFNISRVIEDKNILFATKRWDFTVDPTVNGEIVSPILVNHPKAWKQINEVCKIITSNGGKIDERCSGHVHIGSSILGVSLEKWITLFKIWGTFEDIIFRLSGGELEEIRCGYNDFSEPIALYVSDCLNKGIEINTKDDLKKLASVFGNFGNEDIRDKGLNIDNIDNDYMRTIEFRCFNGTLDPIQIQTNVLIAGSIVQAACDLSIENKFNKERINILNKFFDKANNEEYIYNPKGDPQKLMAFVDVICTNLNDKLRIIELYSRTKEVDFTEHNAQAKERISRTKEYGGLIYG